MSLDRTSGRTADAGRVDGGAWPMGARAAVRLAWTITALAISSGVSFLALLALNSRDPGVITYEYWGAQAVTAIIFPAVGALIVSRHPRNALGWLFCLIGLSSGLSGLALEYATHALVVRPGLPGAATAAWFNAWAGTFAFVSLALIPLLFPDGRPPSRRWMPLAWIAGGAIVLGTVSFALMPGPLEGYPSVANPFGIEGARSILETVLSVGWFVIVITLFAGIVSLVIRYRRSQGAERQQIKWFPYAVAMLPVALLGNDLFPDLSWLIGGVGVACMPLAIGIAVLRHNLYDIDFIINRTLVYGALTAVVVGIYVLVVGYLGVLFSTGGNLAISLVATGLVAVLFAPLRDRVQSGVNRLMYGERDEPYIALSRLGRRLEGTLAPEAVLPVIVEDVARALRLPNVEIWLADGQVLRLGAAYGGTFGDVPSDITVQDAGAVERMRRAPDGLQPAELGPSSEYGMALAGRGAALALPLAHQGELVGALSVTPRAPGEDFSPADRLLLRDLAAQSGAAAHAVSLTVALRSSLEDLRRSRERLVAAQEEERRRIQRDLHDGLGPVLASMRLRLEACLDVAQASDDPLSGDLERLYELVGQATADIRRLVYDLRPPVLDQLGLVPALQQHCERFSRESGIEVSFQSAPDLSIPAAAEVTFLRVVQEALLNVQRHARASRVDVRLGSRDGCFELKIRDDGIGFDVSAFGDGTGINSMRERAELLGGTLRIFGHSGSGTEVEVRIPIQEAER